MEGHPLISEHHATLGELRQDYSETTSQMEQKDESWRKEFIITLGGILDDESAVLQTMHATIESAIANPYEHKLTDEDINGFKNELLNIARRQEQIREERQKLKSLGNGQEARPTVQIQPQQERMIRYDSSGDRKEDERRLGNWQVAGATEAAAIRNRHKQGKTNEDRICIERVTLGQRGENLLLVVDGVGGHSSGAAAAELIQSFFRKSYAAIREKQGEQTPELIEAALKHAISETNKHLYDKNSKDDEDQLPGGTMAAMVLTDTGSYVSANVGDARNYTISEGGISRVSKDHTVVESKMQIGEIKNRYTDPQRSHVLRAIGSNSQVVGSFAHGQLKKGDRVLVCSDGIWDATQDEDGSVIYKLITEGSPTVDEATGKLMEVGRDLGEDNVSAIVAEFVGD